jgi:hypothetical protein
LHRPLFGAIQNGIRKGGYFIGIFHLAIASSSSDHSYLVQPGELKRLVQDWQWKAIRSQEENRRSTDANTQLADSVIVARRPTRRSGSLI